MRDYLFRLPDSSGASLQTQVREMLVSAILDGHIPDGAPLPSCRRLAHQLSVSRNTVVLAYERLVEEGYLLSKERSGYFVNGDILAGRVRAAPSKDAPAAMPPDWDRRFASRPSALKHVRKPLDWERYPYPFVYGQLDPALLPIADWRECCRQALSVLEMRGWARDLIDHDDPLLVQEIRTRVLPRRGVWAEPDQILITMGAQHALYILASLLMRRDTVVGIENPGYPDARNIFSTVSDHLLPLRVDHQGLVVDEIPERCRYVFVTPSHHCPTTATLPLARREALLSRARANDLIVIEDDYEAETNYVGEPTPALKSLDTDQRVVYVGSLSKTLAPGLRVGYMVGAADLIREARAMRRLMLRHPPTNNQRTVAHFLSAGHHDSLVRRLSHAYTARWQLMGRLLSELLPNASQPSTFGGTSFWVAGPETLDASALATLAEQHGIIIEPGEIYFAQHNAPKNYFRLGFSSIPVERIEPGLRALAGLIDGMSAAAGADHPRH